MKRFRLVMLIVAGMLCIAALAFADVPRVINYQGKFTDKNDNPLAGNYLTTFRFYDVASGGGALWEESHILTMQKGIFNALLGSIKPFDVDFNKDLWLGIEIASDGEMSPRIKLTSSAYAMNAGSIDMLNSSQLLRNDIDSVMSGSLTLKKDLILTDGQGREHFLWIDSAGNMRMKQGRPVSDKDGDLIAKQSSSRISSAFTQNASVLLLIVAILILGLVLYSLKKK